MPIMLRIPYCRRVRYLLPEWISQHADCSLRVQNGLVASSTRRSTLITPRAHIQASSSSRFLFFFLSFFRSSPTAPTAARAGPSSGATNAFARSSCRVAVTAACYVRVINVSVRQDWQRGKHSSDTHLCSTALVLLLLLLTGFEKVFSRFKLQIDL